MNLEVINKMKEIVGEDWVVSDLSQMQRYLYDETELFVRPQASDECMIVKPSNSEEISRIVKYANEVLIPIVLRGGGTGICAGAIPTEPSIVLSLERLNKLIEIDDENLMVTVDSGVTLAALNETLDKHQNLFFPIHPGDEGAQIGGMVAENAGGVRAIKHGVTRNYVKGLEVVLPTGEIVNMGGKLLKNNMGYDLLHMMIGSEGTLGIITKVILRLYGKINHIMTMVVSFDNKEDAASVVPKILQKGITPLAIEYIEKDIAVKTAKHIGKTWPAKIGKVDLIFIIDGVTENDLYRLSEEIVEICEDSNAVDTIIADNKKDQRNILEIRSNVYTAFKEEFADTLDVAVPPSLIPNIIEDFSRIAKKYNTSSPICGHVGDGNIHNFILRDQGEIPAYMDDMKQDMYEAAIKYGGTVTAEHGTGKIKKKYMKLQFSEREIEIMKGIKKAFDPNNILCPGNIIN